jgi:drug/metabolite transporter (DMT)-like permease
MGRGSVLRGALVLAVLVGLGMMAGLARQDAYGSAPAAGVAFGIIAGASYAGFLLLFRAANRTLAPAAGPLLDSTVGMLVGALLFAPFDAGFSPAPVWPAHEWLILLALVSQVGALCIATALPRLPALEVSVILLVQPVFALGWGVAFFAEHLSMPQWEGSALVLAGVLSMGVLDSQGVSV